MRPTLMATFTASLLIFVAVQSKADWRKTNGPHPRSIYALAWVDTKLFAGTGEGVYVSNDSGKSWDVRNAGLAREDYWGFPIWSVGALAVVDTFIYAGVNWGGIVRSSKNRTFWTTCNSPSGANAFLVRDSLLFAGSGLGVFCSTDSGFSWQARNSGLTETDVNTLAILDSTIFAGTFRGVFRSSNNGTTWMACDTALSSKDVHTLAVNGHDLYAGCSGNGKIYRSTDNGDSWSLRDSGLTNPWITYVTSFTFDGDTIYAGTFGGGIYLSTNNGVSWAPHPTGFADRYATCFLPNGSDLYVGTSEGGVLLSSDHGTSWSAMNAGMKDPWIFSLAVDGSRIFAGSDESVLLSTDDGVNWTDIGNFGDAYIRAITFKDSMLFVGSSGQGVYRTTDLGQRWKGVDSGLTDWHVMSLVVHDLNLFAGTEYGLFRSTDRGTSWTIDTSGLTQKEIWALAAQGENVYAGTYGGAFVSTNNGSTWNKSTSGMGQVWMINTFAVSGSGIFAGSRENGVFVSTDGGGSWTQCNTGLTDTSVWALTASGKNVFAGTANGVFLTTNSGQNWTSVSAGLSQPSIYALAASGSTLFAGNLWGIWRRPLSEMITSVEQGPSPVPTWFSLDQNYPNPFNPTTTIGYALPHQSHVTLIVYNSLGQRIAQLVNGNTDAGSHTVVFDGSNLASGVYFYRFTAGAFVQTKRLLLLR